MESSAPTSTQHRGGGLCDSCSHQRLVRNTRGSVFSLCERSRLDPAYPRYPRLPVLACPGHEPRAPDPPLPDRGG
jgi:hypothetical protein